MTSLVIYSKRKCNLKPESQLVSRQHLSCYTDTETEKTFKIAPTEEIHPSGTVITFVLIARNGLLVYLVLVSLI
jgi:hypothetical protein